MGEASDVCPNCGGTDLLKDYEVGEVVCRGCGMVVSSIIISKFPEYLMQQGSPERRMITHSYPAAISRHSPLWNSDLDDKAISDFSRGLEETSPARLRRHESYAQLTTTERNVNIVTSEITKVGFKIMAPQEVFKEASGIYRSLIREKKIRGRSMQGLAAGCVYIAARRQGFITNLDDICQAAGITKKEGGRNYRFLVRRIGKKIPAHKQRTYLDKFVKVMSLAPETRMLAERILALEVKRKMTSGRGPAGVVAAAIYIANILGERNPLTQGEVAMGASVTEVTIRSRYREIVAKFQFTMQL